ncbi:MAG: hypothetical protein FJ033_00360 [Chloroflexi bacterium]|nr:hypothetical protein [Chloroflexota bacterium]
MVYRIAGLHRTRIDELRPFLTEARVVEDAEVASLVVEMGGGRDGLSVEATATGYYVHWWSRRLLPGIGDTRDRVYRNLRAWTGELAATEAYADLDRTGGDLTVGRRRLIPYPALARLAANIIRGGLDDVVALRESVERLIATRLAGD